MKISAEKFWEILFTDEAFAFKDWKKKPHTGADGVITPKRFDEALVVLNGLLEDLHHDVRTTAIRDLASAIKKICPEVIPQIVEAARPYETFLAFMQPIEPYTDHSGTQPPKIFGVTEEQRARARARFLEISLMMEKHSRGYDVPVSMATFPSKLLHEWCDLAKRIEAGE